MKLKAHYTQMPNTRCDVIETGLTGDNDRIEIAFATTIPILTSGTYDSSTFLVEMTDKGTIWQVVVTRVLADDWLLVGERDPSVETSRPGTVDHRQCE